MVYFQFFHRRATHSFFFFFTVAAQPKEGNFILPEPKCFKQHHVDPSDVCLKLPPPIKEDGTPASRVGVTCGLSTLIPADKQGSCADAQSVLDAHNAARARWGAPPLLWSKTLSAYAQSVSNTCQFAHSNGPYGENLAIGSGLSCKGSFDLWMDEARLWPPGGTPGFSSSTGHFSAIVWKSTTQVGCGIRSCGGGNLITCSYNPPGMYLCM